MATNRFPDDPNRTIDDYLDRWARWRRYANRIPTGHTGSALSKLYAEGTEIEHHSRRVREQERSLSVVIKTLRARIRQHKRAHKLTGDPAELEAAFELTRVLKLRPKTLAQLPIASLIQGTGYKREADNPVEEAVELAVSRLGGRYLDVIRRNYVNPLPQDQNAKQMGVSTRTFQRWLQYAKNQVARELGISGVPKS